MISYLKAAGRDRAFGRLGSDGAGNDHVSGLS